VSREFLQSVSVGTDGFDIVVTNLPAVRGSVARRPSTVQKVGRRSDENKRRVLRVLRGSEIDEPLHHWSFLLEGTAPAAATYQDGRTYSGRRQPGTCERL
jgi:hypothetical protein